MIRRRLPYQLPPGHSLPPEYELGVGVSQMRIWGDGRSDEPGTMLSGLLRRGECKVIEIPLYPPRLHRAASKSK